MRNYLMEDWLMEADIPASTSPPDVMSGSSNQDAFSNNPSITNPPSQNMYNEPKQNQQNQSQDDEDDDFNDDPVNPHMPDDSDQKQKKESFESWKNSYFKESVKGTSEKLLEMINLIRDKGGFTTYQRKFIEDNWNVQLLRQNANIERASNDIRRSIKERLDKHNPSTSLVSHMNAVLETQPLLATIFIKLNGYGSLKADLHRKFLCALFGCVQVGSGAFNEDIIYNEDDYSVAISTRFNSDFGDFYLGNWSLKSSDPERYLSEPELKRMSEGSPEERDVLKRRVILESIANQYLTRSFIFNVVGEDGTVYSIGMDIAGCIKSAYKDGKLIVKTTINESSEGMLTDEGEIVSYMDLNIYYAKETGHQKDDGQPEVKELPFIQRKGNQLFLSADLNTLKEASNVLQGIIFKELPYNGNPSDLRPLSRCIYTSSELLLRQC